MGNVVASPTVSWFDRLVVIPFLLFLDRFIPWYYMPAILGVVYLDARKHLMQRNNLKPVGKAGNPFEAAQYTFRSLDGSHDDPSDAQAGSYLSFLGRNMAPQDQPLDGSPGKGLPDRYTPDPFLVAKTLLARDPRPTDPKAITRYVTAGTQFNVLAASWIQFMIHDWFDHLEDDLHSTTLEAATGAVDYVPGCPLTKMRFKDTATFPTGKPDVKSGHKNIRTPWWDGSAIYGQNPETARSIRTFKGGRIVDATDGLLPHKPNGVAKIGDVRNSWIGVSILQALFVKEHNYVADQLGAIYPTWGDEKLYGTARLVVAAEVAKIHTIDWTCELLKMPTLNIAMKANWYGLLGKKFKETFGHTGITELSGLVGHKKPDNHGVTYSLTEEFCSVYRMHSLLPDEIVVRDIDASELVEIDPKVGSRGKPPQKKIIPMAELHNVVGEETLAREGFQTMLTALGFQSCGMLKLNNYPNFLRDVAPENVDGTKRNDHVDVAALEIWRDRERGVPRYNNFRRGLHMAPIKTWADLTDDLKEQQKLQSVYRNNVEELDLLVGMAAERFIDGFAISETAFYIFIIMASRRLEADRFFNTDFTPERYSPEGFAMVQKTEGIADVIKRHYPDVHSKYLAGQGISGFNTWDAIPPKKPFLPWFVTPKKKDGPIVT